MDEIMRKINDDMFNGFKQHIDKQSSLPRDVFLTAFLSTLLGDIRGKPTDSRLKRYVDSTSLCSPEVEFMHAMIDAPYDIKGYIKLFHETEDLHRCQLGPLMLQMLEYCSQK